MTTPMPTMLDAIVKTLYTEQPRVPLYHYTSLGGMMGIVKERSLWASDLRYVNDSAEIQHFVNLLEVRAQGVMGFTEVAIEKEALGQFHTWLQHRQHMGPMIFAASLTENGNLLSQWRGYTPHGRGVSLGFDPGVFIRSTEIAGYAIGRCVYEYRKQDEICQQVVSAVLKLCEINGSQANVHVSQSYWPIFESVEGAIILIAALMKHQSFSEEAEWRCVIGPVRNFRDEDIHYREGSSMLIPYRKMPLPALNDMLAVSTVYVGPTPTPNESISSIGNYLSRYANTGQQRSLLACGIPYRG